MSAASKATCAAALLGASLVGGVSAADRRVEVWIQPYIPDRTSADPANFVRTAAGPAIKAPDGACFGIDAGPRRGTPADPARLTTRFTVVISGRDVRLEAPAGSEIHTINETHKLDCRTGAVLATARAGRGGLSVGDVKSSQFFRTVFLRASAANPFAPAPVAIDYNLTVRYDIRTRVLELIGVRGTFPAFVGYYAVDGGTPVKFLDQQPTGSPWSLIDLNLGLNTANFDRKIPLA
jgi:hypothetical protein